MIAKNLRNLHDYYKKKKKNNKKKKKTPKIIFFLNQISIKYLILFHL